MLILVPIREAVPLALILVPIREAVPLLPAVRLVLLLQHMWESTNIIGSRDSKSSQNLHHHGQQLTICSSTNVIPLKPQDVIVAVSLQLLLEICL
jgi:hypothetical protein